MKKEFQYLVIDNEDGPIDYYQQIFHLKLSPEGAVVFPILEESWNGAIGYGIFE